eukprot:gnl/MRDRNA2_/MRDRNA2_76675_c0_seq1.p1 gnl/MRDRNA2_/MRDRNA2_76675_c0~~gnl/MRDRNA2_/MRDRNA2_76675_c0_seq1.p1  ORF type:complete len:543 (+),score=82.45 gnl/MRDRNA2_/MRDRNA2_76675_c0_seq1:38-1630(+)
MPRTCFNARLPSSVIGSFFISGPAQFEMGGVRFNSLFDGYGRANRFELHQNKVCWTSKQINSSYYQAAEKLGSVGPGLYFYNTTPERPPGSPMQDLKAPNDNNWVNIMQLGANGVLLTDSPNMLSFNFETLDATGSYKWEDNLERSVGPPWLKPGHRAGGGSAHPVLQPGTDSTYIALMQEVGIPNFNKIRNSLLTGTFTAIAIMFTAYALGLPAFVTALAELATVVLALRGALNAFAKPSVFIDLYSIDSIPGKTRKLVASVPSEHWQYFHSFGVSQHYIVLPKNLKVGMPSLSKRPYLIDMFQESWGGIQVVDLQGGVQTFDTEKFFHVHVANTFENETGIVMDLGTGKVLPFGKTPALVTSLFLNKTARDKNARFGTVMERIHLHLSGSLKGKVTRAVFTSPTRTVDFFKINPLFNGKPYCVYYATEWFHDDKSYASMAILQHNICTGTKRYWHRPYSYPGEPFFIPGKSGGETDGHVIFVTLNGKRRASDLVILDGSSLQEVSVTNLPQHIPFLAHGQFFKAKSTA